LALLTFPGILMVPALQASAQQPSVEQRCRDTSRVLLASADKWTLTYSWTGGYGPGSVWVTVGSDGTTLLEAQRGEQPRRKVRQVRLRANVVAELAHKIDDTGLLCETPVLRARMVFDIGRFAVRVRQGAYDKEVFADECHALQNGDGLSAVIHILQDQGKLLGPEISWGPYASTTGGPCTGQ
jgi:hypothetical protein